MKWMVIFLLICYTAMAMAQKPPMPKQTALLSGWNRSLNQNHYKSAALSLERTLMRHGSLQFGIGLNCLGQPRSPLYKKLDTQLFSELRYYLLLRRKHALSGIYGGFFIGLNRERWIYRAQSQTAIRTIFADFGPSIGYQHAIGRYIRLNQGIAAGHRTAPHEMHFAPNGDIDSNSRTGYNWFSALWYIRIGVVW